MKAINQIIVRLIVGCVLALSLPSITQAQLQFTDVRATEQRTIRLSWTSQTNEVYEIQYANELLDASLGGTVWQSLYTDYPSHGTNTFIADAGNFDLSPAIPHPKLSPVRFYRVMLVETNTSSTNPNVSIISPTNGASLSGDVTIVVASSSSEFLTDVKLYVDGEEQWSSVDRTNFVINSCEWPNGSHTLYAIAKSQSGLEGIANGPDITYGRSVSSYRNVTFNNLITRFDFSEPFFEPALGQTQQVTATFAANVNWTLEIQNASSNDVRYVTGSGGTMAFDWNGTGTNGVALPDGVYSYLLTAQTNGQALMSMSGGGALSLLVNSASLTEQAASNSWYPTSAKAALAAGLTSYYVQTPPMPLVPVKVNGKLKFVPWEEVYGPQKPIEVQIPSTTQEMFLQSLAGPQSNGSQNFSGTPSQSTRGPKGKPRVGVKGEVGTFGILYKTYGKDGFTAQHPPTGWPYPLPTRVGIDGQSANALTVDKRIAEYPKIAKDFAEWMKKADWKSTFNKLNDQWGSVDIKKASLGGNAIFNTVNFGLLMTHGSYGNNNNGGAESDGVKYTYCALLRLSDGLKEWVRLSDMDFGSAGANGLRWMTIYACNILRSDNYTSMNNAGRIPVNEDLHLLLGPSSTAWACDALGAQYANNLTRNDRTVINAFNEAGAYAHTLDQIPAPVKFAVSGWPACFNDKLSVYNDPDPINGLQYLETPIYTP